MSWMTPTIERYRAAQLGVVERFANAIGAEVERLVDRSAFGFYIPLPGIRFTVSTLGGEGAFVDTLVKAYIDACYLWKQARWAMFHVGEHEGEWLA